MLCTAIAVLLAGSLRVAPNVTPKITSVSLFKNGYAVVQREMDLPGAGEYVLDPMPQGSNGTLWFNAGEGTQIESVNTFKTTVSSAHAVGSLDEILQANVGSEVTVLAKIDDKSRTIGGKILSATGTLVVIEGSTTIAVVKSTILSVEASTGHLLYTTPTSSQTQGLRLKVSASRTSPKAGEPLKVNIVTLERGMTWIPAYAVDLLDSNQLQLTLKATLVNDMADIKEAEVRCITGFPNIRYARTADPLTSGDSVDTLTGYVGPARVSPGGLGGQLIGGQGLVGDSIDYITYDPTDNSLVVRDGPPVSKLPGMRLEDLFFYRQPDITLDRGERAYHILFHAKAPYENVYTWDIPDVVSNNTQYTQNSGLESEGEVWHTLTFKNTSGQPLTSGPVTTFKQGEIVGEDAMRYVPASGDAEIRVSLALDVQTSSCEEEVARQRAALRDKLNRPTWDLVTLKGTLVIKNLRKEKAKLHVRKEFTGEFVSATDNPDVKKTSRGLRQMNPTGALAWTKTIAPGDSATITYSYKLYVQAQ